MKPLIKSLKYDRFWKRAGYSLNYSTNYIKTESSLKKNYKTLSFTYDFLFEKDEVQFAYSFPYSTQHMS